MPGEADKFAPRPRPGYVALAVAGYFPILGLLLLATELFALDLRAGGFLFSRPTGWKLFLEAAYYLGPLAAGMVAGLACGPSPSISGPPRPHFSQTMHIAKGLGRLEIVLPAGRLKELGRDGPYRLRGLVLLNNDPYCPGGACAIVNRPPFTVYLPEYETKPYRVDRFE